MASFTPTTDAPVGSRWYAQGQHVQIIGHTHRDGEPAVLLKADGTKHTASVIARLFLRKAERTV